MNYDVKVLKFEIIEELPGGWTESDYVEVLKLADFDEVETIDPSELRDYVLMVLHEFEEDEAGEIVLTYQLGEKLSKGQISNMAHEMMDEKLWEEYTDISLHQQLYNCATLLRSAFPNKFPETEAVKCVMSVKPEKALTNLKLTKSFLCRLLAHGMDQHAIINRLFTDQVKKGPFPEAEGIIWYFDSYLSNEEILITLFSSEYWIRDMNEISSYNSNAFSD